MVQLEDLDDDCLLEVLERLPPKILFKMLQVNKRWKRLAAVKMRTKIVAIEMVEPNKEFTGCAHLNQSGHLISPDQVLFLHPAFKLVSQPVQAAPKRINFFSVLSKCPGVKSIDFSGATSKSLPVNALLKVFERCSQLECIKFGLFVYEEDEWSRVLDRIGERIVHLSNINAEMLVKTESMSQIVAKCPNIKQIDCKENKLNTNLFEAFKMLPKSYRISLCCKTLAEIDIDEHLSWIDYEDVVDELAIEELLWSSFAGRRLDRLSSLTISGFVYHGVVADLAGVNFAGLKRLELSLMPHFFQKAVECLAASQFPKLEVFCFNVCNGHSEEDFNLMFQRMASVKKMSIYTCDLFETEVVANFPGSAINHLKNLEIIYLNISFIQKSRQPKNLPEKLEQYVNGISSLKKLTVEITQEMDDMKQKVVDKVKELKLKQNRIQINLLTVSLL